MAGPHVVRFPGYRDWEAKRVEASNAMMGLLAGAQLAAHLLKLTAGSRHLLPELFPRVNHIGRFNLTSEDASAILTAADTHLGAMSVPYALALHEDYLKTCLGLLHRAGLCSSGTVSNTKLASQHAKLADLTGGTLSVGRLLQLATIRRMRNCTIHEGGRADAALVSSIAAWTSTTEKLWTRVAPSLKGLTEGDAIGFGHQELILALAVTKELSREANLLIQPVVPRDVWADVVVEDVTGQHQGYLPKRPEIMRLIRGVARFHYGPLRLTDDELRSALSRSMSK